MDPSLVPGPAFFAASAAAIAFMVIYPLVVAVVVHRRLGVGWRYFLYGALIFLVFQILTRLPAVQLLQPVVAPRLAASPVAAWLWLVFLALTAGLFEEVGRYLGYRVLMRNEEKTWPKAILYGVGHGGLESIVLVAGLAIVTLVQIQALASGGLEQLPPAQQAAVAEQLRNLAAQPGWAPLLGAWERLWTLPLHVGLSVMVLQVFRRGTLWWLWLAIGWHAAVDFLTVALPMALGHSLATTGLQEAVVAVCGAVSLWIIFRLRDTPVPPAPVTPLSAPEQPRPA